jgi:hypothetical protein
MLKLRGGFTLNDKFMGLIELPSSIARASSYAFSSKFNVLQVR